MEDGIRKKIIEWLVFFYLMLFPFGQIIRWQIYFGNVTFPIHPVDFIVGLIFLVTITGKLKKPLFFRSIQNFLEISFFSLVISLFIFKSFAIALGALYLLRIYAYSYLLVAVWNVFNKESLKEKLFKSLLVVALAVAVFGWFQYFFYPDIRPLIEWGWDDHLYRLVGTFLDPAFTGLILVFGFIQSLSRFLIEKKKRLLLAAVFFGLTLAFTYSRAGYLSLIGGLVVVLLALGKIKKIVLIIPVAIGVLLLLPRPSSEGVQLERLKSIYARGTNYIETLEIASKSPLFGVGFNNLCLARQKYFGKGEFSSHSCSGSDSSLLFVLATTGVAGLIFFLHMGFSVFRSLTKNIYGITTLGCFIALTIHGFFSNSYFYPWIMGYSVLLLGLSLRESN